ncbi:MAG: ATP-binding protein [Colwellia sp.]|nr:ATP-binding protein [Colwellia sp.]
MNIEKTEEIKADDNIVMVIYGKGGTGKTTFAASAPNPLILDFENGTKFLGDRGIKADVIRFSEWITKAEKQQLAGMIDNYDSIILDPLGEAMDKLIESKEIVGKLYRNGNGGLTMAGWGEVKKQMKSFLKYLRDTGKNIIIVSHVNEFQSDDGLNHRIQVATKLSDEIPNMVDVISYMGVKTEDETVKRILYTPTQGGTFDSKDRTGKIPMTVEVSELNGWSDLIKSMQVEEENA